MDFVTIHSWGYQEYSSLHTTSAKPAPTPGAQPVKHTVELIRVFQDYGVTFTWEMSLLYGSGGLYQATLIYNKPGSSSPNAISSRAHTTEAEAKEETAIYALRELQMEGNERAAQFLASQ